MPAVGETVSPVPWTCWPPAGVVPSGPEGKRPGHNAGPTGTAPGDDIKLSAGWSFGLAVAFARKIELEPRPLGIVVPTQDPEMYAWRFYSRRNPSYL